VSGILGLIALFLVLLMPVPYFLGILLQSEFVMLFGWGGEILAVFALGILGIVLAIYARCRGAWAIIGVATSASSIVAVLVASAILLAVLFGGGI